MSHSLTSKGKDVLSLIESYLTIDTDLELSNLRKILKEGNSLIPTRAVRDQFSPIRGKLRAKQALLEAIFAILPKEENTSLTE